MLRLINVCKSYKYGNNEFVVLDNVNLDFKKKEMVLALFSFAIPTVNMFWLSRPTARSFVESNAAESS